MDSPIPSRDAARASDARSSGLAPTSRTRGGHGTAGVELGRTAGGGQRGERLEQRAEILPCVEPAGEDEVALGQPEPVTQLDRLGPCPAVAERRPECRTRRQRHDPDPVLVQVQQPPGGPRGGVAAHDHGSGLAELLRSQALTEPTGRRALELVRHLPGRQVEQAHHDRQARGDRQRAAPDGVVDGTGRPAALGPPGCAQAGATQQEGIDGHRRRTKQARRWQQAPTDDLEMSVAARSGRPGRSEGRGQRTRPAIGSASKARSRPSRYVAVRGARSGVWSGRTSSTTRTPARRRRDGRPETAHRGFGHGRPRRRSRSRSSSARSWTTTTSASATIRRLIFDCPTRRSRKVIGSSRIRAPDRAARNVISIWKT